MLVKIAYFHLCAELKQCITKEKAINHECVVA